MTCADFAAEQYELYALGLLEPDRASLLSSHLAEACETCGQGVRRSLTFWALFGATAAGTPPAAQLEIAVPASFKSPQATNLRSFPSAPKLSQRRWQSLAAAAALVAVSLSTGIWFGNRESQLSPATAPPTQRNVPTQVATSASSALETRIRQLATERDRALEERRQADARLEDANRAIARATEELNSTRTTLAQLQRQPGTTPTGTTPSGTTPTGTTTAPNDSTRQLAQLQTQLTAAQASIAAAQTEQARLQQQLTASERSSQAAETQLRTLTAQSAAVAAERTRLVQALAVNQQRDTQNARILTALADPGARFVAVRGTEAAPNARGYAVLTQQQGRSLFYAAGLPDLPAGREYQLWLIRARTPAVVSGGVFRAGSTTAARLDFTNPSSTADVVGVAVTDEPAGGSAQPTGHKLLAGTVRS